MSEEELRRRYDAQSRGSAGVSGRGEDFSEMVAKEMANRKKQRMEKESRDREKKGKEYRF